MPWTEEEARSLVGRTVKTLTDLYTPTGVSGQITDVEFGDVSGWLCCVRWIDGSYTWIGQDDVDVNVEIEG